MLAEVIVSSHLHNIRSFSQGHRSGLFPALILSTEAQHLCVWLRSFCLESILKDAQSTEHTNIYTRATRWAVSLVKSSGISIGGGNAHRSLLLAAWHRGRSIRQLDWTRERSASAWGEGTGTVPGSSCHGYGPGNTFRLVLDPFLPWERKTGKGPKDKRAIFVYFPLQPSALSVPIRPKGKTD